MIRSHRRDVGGVAGQDPGAHRHAVAGHRERDDHLRIVVAALLGVPALPQRREGQAAPALGRDVLVVAFEPGGGGVVEDQVDVELEQIDAVPEHLLLDRIAVLGQDVERAIELVEGEIPGLGQPDPIEPALVAGELGARPGEALRGHRQQAPPHAVRAAPRPPAGRRSPGRCRAGPRAARPRGRRRARSSPRSRSPVRAAFAPAAAVAGVGIEHPADAAHQPLQRGAVEAIGAAEAVHHLGLDVALLGMADVLGERVVADDRAVLVPALRGPKVHAHAYSVSRSLQSTEISQFVCLQIWPPKAHLRREKRNEINAPCSPDRPKCAH